MKMLLMNLLFVLLFVLSTSIISQAADFLRDGCKVTSGNVRFDVLAPSLVRMQCSNDGFVDVPTAVIINRNMECTDYEVSSNSGWLEIETPKFLLRYKIGSDAFTSETLRVIWQNESGLYHWVPGTSDNKNLGGPITSFNSIMEETRPENTLPDFPDGFLSRNGYYLLNDSKSPTWDDASQWIVPRKNKDGQDLYLFVYGTDFKDFFKQYTELLGKIPMIPRYTLGTWVTDLNFEYFGEKVPDSYFPSMIERFRKEDIPLDMLVLDFAWHLYGWNGGLDWSPIIADPPAFMKKMKSMGIRVTMNDHPTKLCVFDTHSVTACEMLGIEHECGDIYRIEKPWKFKTDPSDTGIKENWFSPDYDDSSWEDIGLGLWEHAGYKGYDGYAWYRQKVEVPDILKDQNIFLTLGCVDDDFDVYVNGKLIKSYTDTTNKVVSTDITDYVNKSGNNLIAVRVFDKGGNGGIVYEPALLNSKEVKEPYMVFNLANKKEAEVYMELHNTMLDEGIVFWWIDGQFAEMDGLNNQMWTNKVYYDAQEKHTGIRSFVFSRYGGDGAHRYPGYFTADCFSNWKVLAYEVPYTLKSGNTLNPYVTHDVGGFIGKLDDNFELYARWVQFGSFNPLCRLHSVHENMVDGNVRLPWNYGQEGIDLVRDFFKLRYRLIPYLYTYCRDVYDTGMPICRPLYLEYPSVNEAYNHFDEYLFGREILVAPIVTPAINGTAKRSIYFPPGNWIDYFTGKSYKGDRIAIYDCPLERMPIFIKEGAIIPMAPDMAYTDQKPLDTVILDIYPSASASEFTLYEDDGITLDYKDGKFSKTLIKAGRERSGEYRIDIAPANGEFKGQLANRAYNIKLHVKQKPESVSVDGEATAFEWDQKAGIATIPVKSKSIRTATSIVVK